MVHVINQNYEGPENSLWGTDYKVALHNSFILVYTPSHHSFPFIMGITSDSTGDVNSHTYLTVLHSKGDGSSLL